MTASAERTALPIQQRMTDGKPSYIFGEIINCSRQYIWLYTTGAQTLTSAKIWTQWNQGGYSTALTWKRKRNVLLHLYLCDISFPDME